MRPASGYLEPQMSHQQYDQNPTTQQYNMQGQYVQTQQPQQQYQPIQQQQYTFNEPTYHPPPHSVAPSQQFAAWGGYGGASVPVEEEQHVPPESVHWEAKLT